MNWQTSGSPSDDPFAKAEADVRTMTSNPWWQTASLPQRAEQVASLLLAGPGEWWLFGAWGRWYRCGLDGHWFPSPAPADPAARRALMRARPGVGNPPVPPQLVPTGPDVNAGAMAGAGLLADGPSAQVVAGVQQALVQAFAVNPEQFRQDDPAFKPGTPTTVAALWGAVLFSAGTPVVLHEHPIVAMFAPYLTVPASQLRWMVAPDLSQLATYYTDRLAAGDPIGAAFIVRTMADVANVLKTDPAFLPGAAALAAICGGTAAQYVQADLGAARYPHAVAKEWLRRCPAEHAAPVVKEAAPGEYLRLALYDLAALLGTLNEGPAHPTELRRTAVAVMAADLQTVPQAVPAVLPWLDPDSARTLQEVLGQTHHPLRELFPQGVRLPSKLSSTEPGKVRALLAITHALAMTCCRLAQVRPQHLEFVVPAACAAELGTPALSRPKGTGELTAWEIINAARKHLEDERTASRTAEAASPVTPAPGDDDPFATRPGAASNPPPAPPAAQPAPSPFGQPAPLDPYGQSAPSAPPPYGQPPAPDQFGQNAFGQPSPADPYGRPPAPGQQFGQPLAGDPYGRDAAAGPSAPDPFGENAPSVPEPYGQAQPPVPEDATAPYMPTFAQSSGQPPAPPWGPPVPPAPQQAEAYPGDATRPYTPPVPGDATAPYMPTFASSNAPPTAPADATAPYQGPFAGGAPQPPAAQQASEAPTGARVIEAYGMRFLCGPDDVERMLTEVRRRGKWAQQLRGQEVSSASAPAVLLVGGPSSGQRRLSRMVARALADVGFSGDQVRGLHLEEIRDRGPEGLAGLLGEHTGHTVLLDGLDELILEDDQGAAYARALYRVRVEGVTETTLVAACTPSRFDALSAAHPELVTDFRVVRMPDLEDGDTRVELLELLGRERYVSFHDDAWPVARRDLASLQGKGRLVNARLVEAYLDRACTRHLGQADATVAVLGDRGFTLGAADLEGIADSFPR